MRRGLCSVICIMILILLSGCWSRVEPKTLAVVTSVIYDVNENDIYRITVELINPAAIGSLKESGSGKSPAITSISEGISLPEAVRNSASNERTIFGGHNKVRFYSERFAKKDMVSIMDYVLRDHLTDESPLTVVIKNDNPELVYSSLIGLSDTVGSYIDSLSKSQPKVISKSVFVKTLNFIKDYYNDGKQPVAGVVEFMESESKPSESNIQNSQGAQSSGSGSSKKYELRYEGLAAFKGDKLVGYMDGTEARAYNFVTNNIKTAVVSVPAGDDMTVALVKKSKADIKTSVEDEQITIDVKIKTGLSIIQETGDLDISKSEPTKVFENSFNQLLGAEISASINKAQNEFESDIFGFGSAFHTQHPEKWKEIKGNWDDYFAKATINVSVESSAARSGEIKHPYRMES